MPGQNKTPLLGWHPADPETGPWVRAQAARRGVPIARVLDEAIRLYRELAEGDGQLIRDVRRDMEREAATAALMAEAESFRL